MLHPAHVEGDDISTLTDCFLKLVDKFTYLGSSVSTTETDISIRLVKAWTAIDRLLVIWKLDLTDKIKRSFFQAVVMLILLYGCTTWTIIKHMEKKLDGNYKRMLKAILNQSLEVAPNKAAAVRPLTTHPSWKLSELDKPDMWDTAWEVGTKWRSPVDPFTWMSKGKMTS